MTYEKTYSAGRAVVNMCFTRLVVGVMVFGLQRDYIQISMTYAAFRNQGIGKTPDIGGQAFQNDCFQAVFVVEMAVHGRHRQIVMIVLQTHQPLGQFAFVMVIDIREIGNAMTGWRVALAVSLNGATDQVTHRLRAVAVTACGDQLVKLPGQSIVKRNREAFHATFPLKKSRLAGDSASPR